MPAATGALFLPLLLVSVWLLGQLPPPNHRDEVERAPRKPMNRRERAAFLAVYGLGVGLLVGSYVLLTAFRDFRDNFAAEIWTGLGFGKASAVFTASEAPVAVFALLIMAGLMAVKDNLKGLIAMHLVILVGFLLLGASTFAFQAHILSPLAWMILSGAGLYMAYTPFNAMLFDRMIAYDGQAGNAGFLIYVADASGYLGSAALLVYRNFFAADLDWLHFFIASAYLTCVVGIVLVGWPRPSSCCARPRSGPATAPGARSRRRVRLRPGPPRPPNPQTFRRPPSERFEAPGRPPGPNEPDCHAGVAASCFNGSGSYQFVGDIHVEAISSSGHAPEPQELFCSPPSRRWSPAPVRPAPWRKPPATRPPRRSMRWSSPAMCSR